jgi:hypothetical protein
MSVRSLGALARQRRNVVQPTPPPAAAAAAAPGADQDGGLSALEQAVPTEIIAFYTTVIAACQTVSQGDPSATFTAYRAAIYAVGLVATAWAAGRSTRTAVSSWGAVLRAPEWWTAVLSFAGWGAAVPGSFLYVWLDPEALIVAVATIIASAGLIIGVVLTPRLKTKDPAAQAGPLTMTRRPPGAGPAEAPS